MGLGISINANIPRKGLSKKPVKQADLFKQLSNAMKSALPAELQSSVFESQVNDNTMTLQLHPSEEPVFFEINDSILTCSAKTNSAGPGYHAFLIEALEKTGDGIDLEWQWFDENDECGDETCYYTSRDYSGLQDEMLLWLRSLAHTLCGKDGYRSLAVSLPVGYTIAEDHFVISPMGFWTKDRLKSIADAEIADLKEAGSAFFPWWEQGFGHDFWFKCALTRAWVDLPWHPAMSDTEVKDYRFVLTCFEKAAGLNGSIVLPEREIAEITSFMNGGDITSPDLTGIGFKKRNMTRRLTGKWTAAIPGYFYDELEDEGSTALYWFNDRTFRGSSYVIGSRDESPDPAEQFIREKFNDPQIMTFSDEHKVGCATIEQIKDDENTYWCLSGEMAVKNSLCNVTICYTDKKDESWAIDAWKSVNMVAE